MTVIAMIVSVGLLIPYFGWGVFTLRARYQFHEELHRSAEIATLLSVAVFFSIELSLMGRWMGDMPLFYAFAALGLTVSAAALYGPILVSVTSLLFVNVVLPDHDDGADQPQFGPAEALERAGDYEAALKEYMVIARIFPSDVSTALKTADTYVKLEQYEDAAKSLERGLRLITDEERSLRVTNRLAEMYTRHLESPNDARRVFESYLDTYPGSERADGIRTRLESLGFSVPTEPDPVPDTADAQGDTEESEELHEPVETQEEEESVIDFEMKVDIELEEVEDEDEDDDSALELELEEPEDEASEVNVKVDVETQAEDSDAGTPDEPDDAMELELDRSELPEDPSV